MASGQPTSSPKATTSSGEVNGSERPGHAGHAGRLGGDARADLVAHHLDRFGRRADEGHAAVGDGPGEVGVLREEPVAGVDAVGPALLDGVEDGLGVQVALGRRLAAEGVRLVGHPDVQGFAVEVGVDGDGGDAHLAAGPDDTDGDFAAVGDEDLLQHAGPFDSGQGTSQLHGPYGVCHVGRDLGRAPVRRDRLDQRLPARPGPPGAPEGTVAVADHQSAGRGRLDRRWEAPAGASLLVSVLFRPEFDPAELHLCTAAVALAAAEACRRVAGVGPVLKWPNDLLVGEAKLAGVLAEAELRRRSGCAVAVVVGLGLNVTGPVPPGSGAPACATSAADAGRPAGAPRRPARTRSPPAGPSSTARRAGARWRPSCANRCATLGQRVRVELAAEAVVGVADRDRRCRPPGGADRRRAPDRVGRRRRPPAPGLSRTCVSRPRAGPEMGTTLSPLCAFSSREEPDSSGRTSSATGSNSIPRTTSSPTTCSPTPATDPTWPTSRTGSSSSKATSATAPLAEKTLRDEDIDTIVHFAAESHNSLAVLNPGLFFRTNVLGTQTLLEAARQVGRGPVPPHQHLRGLRRPGARYGRGLHRGLPLPPPHARTTPARPGPTTPCGPTARPTSCRSPSPTAPTTTGPYQFPEKVIPVFTTSALDDKNLTLYATTENRREWLHVRDHCTAIEAVLAAGQDRRDVPRGQRRRGLHHGDRRPGAGDAWASRPRSRRSCPTAPATTAATCSTRPSSAPSWAGRPRSPGRTAWPRPSSGTPANRAWWEPLRARAPVVEGGWGAAG